MPNTCRRAYHGLLVLAATFAQGAPRESPLPPETVKLKSTSEPGSAIAATKCAICHSADYIAYQPPGMNLAQWTGEAAKMQHTYGAPLSDDEVKAIGAYLAVAYGSAHSGDPDVIAAGARVANASTAPTAGAIDAKSLLDANGCLGCHALDHKIVGPAYHEVAARYAGQTNAVANLVASIRGGSVGKWGNVPMPAMASVTPAQAQALAEFVLRQ